MYLRNGTPVFAVRAMDGKLLTISAPEKLSGKSQVGLRFNRKGPEEARATISVNGEDVAESEITGALSVYIFSGNETFDIGSDPGTTVLDGVIAPFEFAGTIGETRFEVASPPR